MKRVSGPVSSAHTDHTRESGTQKPYRARYRNRLGGDDHVIEITVDGAHVVEADQVHSFGQENGIDRHIFQQPENPYATVIVDRKSTRLNSSHGS